MVLSYTDTKEFSPAALEELFLSVQWESGRHPERLAKALLHYGAVFSAWDGGRLAGLIAAMDDGTMTAYVHYLLVHPLYQGCGVGSRLLELCKRRYAGYLNVVLTSYREGVPFYERNGFITDRTQEAMRFIPPSSGGNRALTDAGRKKGRPSYGMRLRNGCMRHMVAVRHSHSRGPYRKRASQRRHAQA